MRTWIPLTVVFVILSSGCTSSLTTDEQVSLLLGDAQAALVPLENELESQDEQEAAEYVAKIQSALASAEDAFRSDDDVASHLRVVQRTLVRAKAHVPEKYRNWVDLVSRIVDRVAARIEMREDDSDDSESAVIRAR